MDLETTNMGKLQKIFSERISVPVDRLRFCFDGCSLNDDDTPKSIWMEKVEEINVLRGLT